MVVVKIELWPHGDESKKRMLGQMNIINEGTGDVVFGNYSTELLHAGTYWGKPGFWKTAKNVIYNRTLSPYHLVAKCLAACGIR
jgi:hypothetical protein